MRLPGFCTLAWGGNFLDYAYLPIPGLSSAELHYQGILIVETGVGMVVWGTLVILFDHLIGSEP
jgi:multicomponent Na+:H+ antiporter subunit B